VNILGYLQKVGRALMVPVAVLPAAAILMGVGYGIDPQGWGGDSATAAGGAFWFSWFFSGNNVTFARSGCSNTRY